MTPAKLPEPRGWTPAPPAASEDRLESLAIALDPERMSAVLAPRVRARFGGDAVIKELAIEVYRRHANRCVIRYGLDCRGGSGPRSWQVIGKVLADARGAKVYETMRRLWKLGFARKARDGIEMPEPIGYEPALAMLLQEQVGGVAVRSLIKQSADPEPCRAAARALVKLQRSGLAGGPTRRVADHLQRCHPRYPFLALACPEVAHQVRSIVHRAVAIEAALGDIEPTTLHGDFHFGQVHVEGDRVWLIDFDAVGRGDPASDVGNLSVFLKDKARRRPAAAALLEAFLDEYFARMDPRIAARIPLYEGLTHLRRACKLLRVQPPGWRARIRDMLERGVCEIDAMERSLAEATSTPGPTLSLFRSTRRETAPSQATQGFGQIQVGWQVRIKGVRAPDGLLQAVQIEDRPPTAR
ncbi:MAG TPA: phosphotransferase, partial [Candidatus Eisenbacteria bacterium]